MRVELLFIEGCPSRRLARANLDAALALAGLSHVPVEEHVVGWEEQQPLPQMHGSPTILIDGVDPFARDADRHSLSCRVYRTSHGVNGAPKREELLAALIDAKPGSRP